MRVVLLAFAALALVGCTTERATEPAPPLQSLARSAERLPTVTVALAADRAAVAPGELVVLTVAATNTGATRVQLGVQCGPSFDVAVAAPTGEERSALRDQLGPNAAFPCPLLPEHFAEPGQTRTQRISWVAPATRGRYTAVAGLRRGDGLGNVSAPLQLTVR